VKHSDTDGLIYYLLDATRLAQRVKIGYTQDLGQRLTALASDTMMRQRPIVLALEEGGTILERKRHEQFRSLWIMGEWFDYEAELREHIAGLPNPIGWLLDRPHLWHYTRGWQSFTGWVRQRANTELLEQTGKVDYEAPDYVPDEVPVPIEI
jgi:hypothetical protein